MKNLTIIIPVHEFNDTVKEYLSKAIKSITEQEGNTDKPQLIVVFPPKAAQVIFFVNDMKLENEVEFVTTTDIASDYQSQVNAGVDSVKTEYFSVLEFDDELGKAYVKNVDQYVKAYPNVSLFMPMIIEVNNENKAVKFSNEIAWSQHFAGDIANIGFLTFDSVKTFSDFKLSGGVFKKSDFIANGLYKTNIKLTFMYEYLLRALNANNKVLIIPKVCYKHLVDRPDSLFVGYSTAMPPKERKFWFDVAMKEYYFNTDRSIELLDDSAK